MKKACGFEAKDDGTFWMSIGDFKEEFGKTTICKARDNYFFDSAEHMFNDKGHVSTFKVTKKTHLNASIC